MKHLKNLIKGTIADSKEPWAISEDMSDMYKQDAKDFKDILNMIKSDNTSGAKKLIQADELFMSSSDVLCNHAIWPYAKNRKLPSFIAAAFK